MRLPVVRAGAGQFRRRSLQKPQKASAEIARPRRPSRGGGWTKKPSSLNWACELGPFSRRVDRPGEIIDQLASAALEYRPPEDSAIWRHMWPEIEKAVAFSG